MEKLFVAIYTFFISLLGINPAEKTIQLTDENVIRQFSEAIDQKNIPQAISFLSNDLTVDSTDKQAWSEQFSLFTKFKIIEIEKWNDPDEIGLFKVNFDVSLKPEGIRAVIPFYGWSEGKNIRWLKVAKDEEGIYKITEIATGP